MSNKSPLELMFLESRAKGFKTVKMKIAGLLFKLAPDSGRNPGAIYITGVADKEYRGKIINNSLYKNDKLTQEEVIIVLDTMANPKDWMMQEGHKTGQCCVCGRPLINKYSVKYGIGPICAEKFGFVVDEADMEDEIDIDLI
jgi:hypothetical protein